MSKINRRKSSYRPSYKWGGNTLLWSSETEQKLIQNSLEKENAKSKEDLNNEISYGERINYWH